jgi:hypothetical protein
MNKIKGRKPIENLTKLRLVNWRVHKNDNPQPEKLRKSKKTINF